MRRINRGRESEKGRKGLQWQREGFMNEPRKRDRDERRVREGGRERWKSEREKG